MVIEKTQMNPHPIFIFFSNPTQINPPAFLGRFLHLPSPWTLMYSVRILSSTTVQAPLFKPSFEQQGLLPILLLSGSLPHSLCHPDFLSVSWENLQLL